MGILDLPFGAFSDGGCDESRSPKEGGRNGAFDSAAACSRTG